MHLHHKQNRSQKLLMVSFFALLVCCASGPQVSAQAPNLTYLYNFPLLSSGTEGNPFYPVSLDAQGNIYGGVLGGTYNNGAVFEFNPTGAYTSIYSFTGEGTDGSGVAGNLVVTTDPLTQRTAVLGTTEQGGPACIWGTVFALTANSSAGWDHNTIYCFAESSEGYNPDGLAIDSEGNLYGVTYGGGQEDVGTVYMLSYSVSEGEWNFTTLYSFQGGSDGAYPTSYPTLDSSGNIYGTTQYGGTANVGTVFELIKNGSQYSKVTLHSFQTGGIDAAYPFQNPLVMTPDGNHIFGATKLGGTYEDGAVYTLEKTAEGWGNESVIYNFEGDTNGSTYDGSFPLGQLVLTSNALYGTTQQGGQYNDGGEGSGGGTIFQLTPPLSGGSWSERIIYSFNPSISEGIYPDGGLILNKANDFVFGTTFEGGEFTLGTIFQVSSSTQF